MRYSEFRVTEASIMEADGLQAKYNAMLASLKKPGSDEGFFGRNRRRTANAEILAKFARDNNLPGMYDPETGNFVYSETNSETGEVEVQTSSNASMETAKQLAGKGLLPDVVRNRFVDQLASAQSNVKVDVDYTYPGSDEPTRPSKTVELPFGKNPELDKDMQEIFKLDGQARQKQEKSKVPTPNTQQFTPKEDPKPEAPKPEAPKSPTNSVPQIVDVPDDEGTGIPKDIPEPAPAQQAANTYAGGNIQGGEFDTSKPAAPKPAAPKPTVTKAPGAAKPGRKPIPKPKKKPPVPPQSDKSNKDAEVIDLPAIDKKAQSGSASLADMWRAWKKRNLGL